MHGRAIGCVSNLDLQSENCGVLPPAPQFLFAHRIRSRINLTDFRHDDLAFHLHQSSQSLWMKQTGIAAGAITRAREKIPDNADVIERVSDVRICPIHSSTVHRHNALIRVRSLFATE